jgi:hypothetical protein
MQFQGIHGRYRVITFTREEMEAIVRVLKFVVTHEYEEMPERGAFYFMEDAFYSADAFETALKQMDSPKPLTHALEVVNSLPEDTAAAIISADKKILRSLSMIWAELRALFIILRIISMTNHGFINPKFLVSIT